MSVSTGLPRRAVQAIQEKKAPSDNDEIFYMFLLGLCVGVFILLLGFIAGTVSASLNPPPVEYVTVPLSYDCTTDSKCEGL